jgi:heme-degrading monooxygenase HmoA
MPYLIIWEFVPHAASRAEFERLYGPHGDWARLFERGAGFLGTQLLRDSQDPSRYLTLDRWDSRQAYEDFLHRHEKEYRALDLRCESLTLRESPLGTFEEAE